MKIILVLSVCLLLGGCQKDIDKTIRYTYLPAGEIKAELPDSYNNNVDLFSIYTNVVPAYTAEITADQAFEYFYEQTLGCWKIIETSDFSKNIEDLCTSLLVDTSYTSIPKGRYGYYTEDLHFYELMRDENNNIYFRISIISEEDIQTKYTG